MHFLIITKHPHKNSIGSAHLNLLSVQILYFFEKSLLSRKMPNMVYNTRLALLFAFYHFACHAQEDTAWKSKEICSFVNEHEPTSLTCPSGQVVSSVDSAMFGRFDNNTTCPSPQVTAECPTPVRAQIELLCIGRPNCSVACFCDADTDPACRCANTDSNFSTGVPVFPCADESKQLAVSVSCAPSVPTNYVANMMRRRETTAAITSLRLQFLESPVIGLDILRPQFSWALTGMQQMAFEIEIFSSTNSSDDPIWYSNIVNSSAPMYVPQQSLPLASDKAYSWSVTIFARPIPASLADFTHFTFQSESKLTSIHSNSNHRAFAPHGDECTHMECEPQKNSCCSGYECRQLTSEFRCEPMESTQEYFDIVSEKATFTTGILKSEDWGPAQWIEAGYCTQSADLTTTGNCSGGLLRTVFTIPANVTPVGRVSLFVSACQYYELYIDGDRIGNRQLDVAWTRFERSRAYASYDLPAQIFKPGKHALGLFVGQGFCGQTADGPGGVGGRRAAILSLRLHGLKNDEIIQTVTTLPGEWQSGDSPLFYESAYFGENYISDLEQPGWSTATFEPNVNVTWSPAVATSYQTSVRLVSQLMQPILPVEEIVPYSCRRVLKEPGSSTFADPPRWTFDMGTEISGHVRLVIPESTPPGTTFTLKHGEVLSHPPLRIEGTSQVTAYDGSVYMGNLFWAKPVDIYQTRSSIQEENSATQDIYEPRFTYHGFRYVELSADPPLPQHVADTINITTITGIRIRTNARRQSDVKIGNPQLQRIYWNSIATEASALMGIPNGAAARGERAGWTGDAGAACESEMVDFDAAAFFSQYLNQIADLSCEADGSLPNCIPESDPHRDGPESRPDPETCSHQTKDLSWSTVLPAVAHNLLKYYNATGVITTHYPKLKRYIDAIGASINATGLSQATCTWGDWNPVIKTPCQITAATSFIRDLQRMADLASAVGEIDDAHFYKSEHDRLVGAFNAAFYDPAKAIYSSGSQMAQGAALWLNAVPNDRLNSTVSALANDVVNKGVTFGFLGVQYVFEALAMHGRIDAAIKCLLRANDGYGHEIYNIFEPSTSLWESWDGDTKHQWLDESSRSHHYQSSISTFLRKYVAGLDVVSSTSGWEIVQIRPEAAMLPSYLASVVPSASAEVDTHHGLIGVSWALRWDRDVVVEREIRENQLLTAVEVNVTIPAPSSAELHLPNAFGTETHILLGNDLIWEHSSKLPLSKKHPIYIGQDGKFIKFQVSSGIYAFRCVRKKE